MKTSITEQRNYGLTRIDAAVAVLLVALLFAILFAMVLPVREAVGHRAQRINCVSNLKQINLALRIWEGDHDHETISLVEGGATNLNSGQQAWMDVLGKTNLLQMAKILHCPADTNPNDKISYFLNLDASETYPQMILDGDDNLAIGGVPVKAGILKLSSNMPVSWTRARHRFVGNLGMADGSVQELSNDGLRNAFEYSFNGTPFATNRIAIP